MDENEQRYIDLLQKQLESEQIRRNSIENQFSQTSDFLPKIDQNLIEYQLDLKEELDRIHHLLSGHVIKKDADGNEYWDEPDDDRLKIFSEYGVKRLMNIIQFYINRNTLLSNYDDETIKWKVRDFGIELADLIFVQYEHFFYYPTPEDLFEKYVDIMHKTNVNISDYELYMKCVQWSKEELQYRVRHYPMIVLSLVDSVHTTYLRALNGEERDSLRKNWHIHENNTQQINPIQNKFSLLKPSTWSGR